MSSFLVLSSISANAVSPFNPLFDEDDADDDATVELNHLVLLLCALSPLIPFSLSLSLSHFQIWVELAMFWWWW